MARSGGGIAGCGHAYTMMGVGTQTRVTRRHKNVKRLQSIVHLVIGLPPVSRLPWIPVLPLMVGLSSGAFLNTGGRTSRSDALDAFIEAPPHDHKAVFLFEFQPLALSLNIGVTLLLCWSQRILFIQKHIRNVEYIKNVECRASGQPGPFMSAPRRRPATTGYI